MLARVRPALNARLDTIFVQQLNHEGLTLWFIRRLLQSSEEAQRSRRQVEAYLELRTTEQVFRDRASTLMYCVTVALVVVMVTMEAVLVWLLWTR